MTNQVERLPVELSEKFTTTTQKKISGDRAVTSLVDTLHKAKIPHTHLISPASKGEVKSTAPSQEYYDDIRASVVLGFSATNQKLIAAPVKSLTDAQKAMRKYWQQQIGGIIGDYKTALEKREKIGQEIAEGGTPSRVRSDSQRLSDNLNDCTKVIEKSEGIDGVDLEALTEAIQNCKRILHGVKH